MSIVEREFVIEHDGIEIKMHRALAYALSASGYIQTTPETTPTDDIYRFEPAPGFEWEEIKEEIDNWTREPLNK